MDDNTLQNQLMYYYRKKDSLVPTHRSNYITVINPSVISLNDALYANANNYCFLTFRL
jgi:hypothetical protein